MGSSVNSGTLVLSGPSGKWLAAAEDLFSGLWKDQLKAGLCLKVLAGCACSVHL